MSPLWPRADRSWRTRLALRVTMALALLAVGCGGPTPLAKLQQAVGTVERDFASRPLAWRAANLGESFSLGDAVQTGPSSTAVLSLDDGALLALQPSTLIRFSATPPAPKTLAFEVELGAARLQVAAEPAALQTHGSLAHLQARSQILLTAHSDSLRFQVEVGEAVLGDLGKASPGTTLVLGQGQVQVERESEPEALGPTQPVILQKATPGEPLARGSDIRVRVQGDGASLRAATGWVPLADASSTVLASGSVVRLASKTTMDVEQGAERVQLAGAGRYILAPKAGVLVASESGEIRVRESALVRVQVPGGVIVVTDQAEVSLSVARELTQVAVASRGALVETAGKVETLQGGERVLLTRTGGIRVEGRTLDYADIELDVGDSITVHDPEPPVAVRFRFPGACPGGATVRVVADEKGKQYGNGKDSVALGLRAGTHRYEVSCVEEQSGATGRGPSNGAHGTTIGKGRVVVVKDAGSRRIAKQPPSVALQADGRAYTVLYQNRLPALNLAWPGGPEGEPVTLIVETGSERREISLTEPGHTFTSGDLPEGSHAFLFSGGGKVSRRTTVAIRFDNAAPAASLNMPVAMTAAPGEATQVVGTAQGGWDVSVDGVKVATDAQGRFAMPVVMPTDRRALAVRVSHPERGAHVYLRRGRR